VIKPGLDFIIAFLLLVLFSPIILLTVIFLAVENKGRVWFIQSRPGKNGKPFTIIKFKTMTDTRNEKGELASDEARMTLVGEWVRKFSLDELPQMINIIKGDMSFVGPRPLLLEYIPLYSKKQLKRHDVKPGITGWAQVNGRNTLEWQKRFEYDVWYVDHVSFWLDLKILWLTLIKVLKAEGISSATSVTMEKFKGNA
jgi:undecaprenyl phosphate N,N'-diacetylbacillosamine 1-phosphate transferase